MAKVFKVYVDTYVKTIDGQIKPAGRGHAIEYRVDAADDVNALLIFRQQHPNLVVGACEEDISAEFANAAAEAQAWSSTAQAWSSAAQTWPSATITQEIPKISGGTWKKMFNKTKNK
jgi:hypothetical protein